MAIAHTTTARIAALPVNCGRFAMDAPSASLRPTVPQECPRGPVRVREPVLAAPCQVSGKGPLDLTRGRTRN
ncbi:hypothetical protein GCM10020219_094150 [Nonomuraea dietziae]